MLSHIFAQLLDLAYRNQSDADLTVLEGRSFVLSIDELPQDVGIMIANNAIVALPDEKVLQADVTISGNVKAILAMIQNTDTGLESDELYISGKISTAKKFQSFLGSLSIDWTKFLNQFLPDEIAQKGAIAIEQSIHFAKGGVEQISQYLQNYLINEKKLLVTQTELYELSKDIKDLHQRIEQQLNKLSLLSSSASFNNNND